MTLLSPSRRFATYSLASLSLLAASLLGPPEALACSLAAPERFSVEADAGSSDAGTGPTLAGAEVSVGRGIGPERVCELARERSSCDDLGGITFRLERGKTADIGVLLEVIEGKAPEGIAESIGEGAFGLSDGSVSLVWVDGATDLQEPVDFVLEARGVDRAGNLSEPLRVPVKHPGYEDVPNCTRSSDAGAVPPGDAAAVPPGDAAATSSKDAGQQPQPEKKGEPTSSSSDPTGCSIGAVGSNGPSWFSLFGGGIAMLVAGRRKHRHR